MFGPDIYKLFQELKATFDPNGLMNPNKIIDTPPMDQNLRYGPDYRATTQPTKLDFSIDTDFAGAIEMCNGMGACRKIEGHMCPSYIATRDEEHSTRGRANLLRAAMSGKLPEGTMTSKRLWEAMDLCLECKGCKAECESGVDMAKIKYEYLDQYHKANGVPLRNRVFGHIGRLSAWGSRTAPFSNLIASNPVGKMMSEMFLGIHPKRNPPKFVRRTFAKWFKARGGSDAQATNTVVLRYKYRVLYAWYHANETSRRAASPAMPRSMLASKRHRLLYRGPYKTSNGRLMRRDGQTTGRRRPNA